MMRIDMVQPQPIPGVPKIAEGDSTSTNYDHLNDQIKDYVTGNETKKALKPGEKSLSEQMENVNNELDRSGRRIQFKILKHPNQIIAQIVDVNTNEVLEEIPPEKLLEILDSIGKTPGQNIDKKV